MTTGNAGSGDAARIGELERTIIDLEKKVSDLTHEVAELNERTEQSERALDACLAGGTRKPVEEEAIERPVTDTPVPDTGTSPASPATDAGPGGAAGEPSVAPAGGGAGDAQALYDRALSEVMDRKAEAALPLFERFVAAYPNDELTDNASYWIGECYYLMSDYGKAIDQFRGVTERFPDKDKAPDALLKVGFCYEKLGESARARETFNAVIASFPGSSAADLAREKVK